MTVSGALPNLVADLIAWSIIGYVSMLGILYSYAYGRARIYPALSFFPIVITLGALLIVGLHVSGRLTGMLDGSDYIGGQPFLLLTVPVVSMVVPYWIAYARLLEPTFAHIDSLILRSRDEQSSARSYSRSPRTRRDSNGGRSRS